MGCARGPSGSLPINSQPRFAIHTGSAMTHAICRPPTSRAITARPPGNRARLAIATLALLLPLAASEARAVIGFVKNIGTNSSATTGTTIAVTVPAAGVATGDSVILTLAMADASGGVTATDSKGNTYSLAADITNASNVRTVILAAHNVTALVSGDTITVTHPSASVRALSANEFSGLSPTSALDQTHTATGSSTAPSSGATAATTEAAELLLGAMGAAGPISDTFTAGTNYTALTRAGTGIGFRGAQSASSGSSSSATSLAISRPAGTVANDVMVASITSRTGSGTPTIAAPSGWTSIVSTNNTSTVTTATFWKVAGTAAADPGPYAFTVSSSSVAGGISAYFNVDTTNPINASNGAVSSSAPSITTTVANTMLVACFGRSGSSAIGAPSGMTERFNAVTSGSNNAASESADVPQATAGATGSKASTGNTATIGQAVALTPATSSAVTIDPEYRIVSATLTYSADGTLNPSRNWAASIATFRAACGDGHVDAGEQCDLVAQNGQSGSCCTATCTFATAATVCRASTGACDPAETCTGSSDTCPPDALSPAGAVCRAAAAGGCDVAETCDGSSVSCPTDAFLPSSTVCRASAGVCDVAENCTGTSATCPTNLFLPSSTVCRPSAGVCDGAENCTGTSATCPADTFLSSSTVCRAAVDVCDAAEKCTGTSATCPADGFLSSSTVCRASAGPCDVAEKCTGSSVSCPADGIQPAGFVCRAAAAGGCDVAETCDGSSVSCPTDAFLPSSTVCRASAGVCDVAENCTGTSVTCPTDAKTS